MKREAEPLVALSYAYMDKVSDDYPFKIRKNLVIYIKKKDSIEFGEYEFSEELIPLKASELDYHSVKHGIKVPDIEEKNYKSIPTLGREGCARDIESTLIAECKSKGKNVIEVCDARAIPYALKGHMEKLYGPEIEIEVVERPDD